MTGNIASVHAVADYFLLKIQSEAGDSITNLKLQKMVYYAQAWCLALNDRPLFQEDIQAWMNGPVCPELYTRFKKFGWQAIDAAVLATNPLKEIDEDDQVLLDEVWEAYSKFSGSELVALTHSDNPWKASYGDRPRGSHCTTEITHEAMKKFYHAQSNNSQKNVPEEKKGQRSLR